MFRLLKHEPLSDTELVAACLQEKRTAQREFFDRFSPKMMAVCLRYCPARQEAEDCLIGAFEKALRQLATYRHLGSLEGWLRRIVVRECLQSLRRTSVLFAEVEIAEQYPAEWPDATSHLNASDLIAMISKLPEGYRMVFNLSVVEGYSHQEIGEILGIEAVTSRSQLNRARQILQKWVNAEQEPALIKA